MVLRYDTRMNQLFEWAPLLAFFVAYKLYGLYWATGVLMVGCVGLLFVHRFVTGRYKTLHIVTAVVALALGGATLILHDKRFIQWKPTVLLGIAALVFLGSSWVGRQPLARRMLESVFTEPLEVPPRTWLVINMLWGSWFALLALGNLYVAANCSESVWVNFKLFGIPAAMMVFMIPQVLWLNSKIRPSAPEGV
jgi:intracellular septation protein